jgi:uncharacterized protein (DUF2249 family)
LFFTVHTVVNYRQVGQWVGRRRRNTVTITLPPGAAIDVVLASGAADAAAVDALREHHAGLAGRLGAHVDALLAAATAPGGAGFRQARTAALRFCTGELLPVAAVEEQLLYPAAAVSDRLRLLVDALLAEHRVLAALVEEIVVADEPARAAAAGYALLVLVEKHLATEDELLVPGLAADPATRLSALVAELHDVLSDVLDATPTAIGSSCRCGGHDEAEIPVLDVRSVPHGIRHATVFGAFDAVPVGGSLLLVAPHDPLPLLDQLSARTGGGLAVDYEQRGPDAWRLRLTRV